MKHTCEKDKRIAELEDLLRHEIARCGQCLAAKALEEAADDPHKK